MLALVDSHSAGGAASGGAGAPLQSTALTPYLPPSMMAGMSTLPPRPYGEGNTATFPRTQLRDVSDDALAESAKGGFHIALGSLSLLANLFLYPSPLRAGAPAIVHRPYVHSVQKLLPELRQPRSKHTPTDTLPRGYPWPTDATIGKLRVLQGILLTYQRILAHYSMVYPAPQTSAVRDSFRYDTRRQPIVAQDGQSATDTTSIYDGNHMYDFSPAPHERSAGTL